MSHNVRCVFQVGEPVLRAVAVAAVAACFSAVSAMAQQSPQAAYAAVFAPAQTAAALHRLSPHAQEVVERLSHLDDLSLGDWRLHIGDVPNAGSMTLDDASWQKITTPYAANTTGVVWLRQWIEVPASLHGYDLTGARLMLQSWGRDWVTVYFNGHRVAEGESLEPIALFNAAQPGQKVLVAVRIAATTRPKNLTAAKVTVEMAPGRPDPADAYTEFVVAALLYPVLSAHPAEARDELEKAIAKVDMAALDGGRQQPFDASLREAHEALSPLRPMLARATFHVTGDSHIDSAWLWPWTETVDVVRRTFATALQLMHEYPDYTYTQSAMQYNVWMADKYPQIQDEIKSRVADGRWEMVGGMWVEPDLNMSDGESQVRQLLIGQRTLKSLYGVTTRIGWNPDSFGYDWQLPQIYKKSGMDYFVTQKLSANETNPLPFKIFWWEAPDGSKVLTYFPHGYGSRNLDPIRLANDFVRARSLNPGFSDMMDLYGVGDHGGGPTRMELDQGSHWAEPGKDVPKMQFGTAQSYFSAVEKTIAPQSPTWNYRTMAEGVTPLPAPPAGMVSIPTWKDELYFEHHRGTYTTQATHKRHMRESEEWLLNSEKYASLAWLYGDAYPAAELNASWKKVLFNQFHDLAAGSGIADIYRDAEVDYDEVRKTTQEASEKSLDDVETHIDTRTHDGVPVLVMNPLGWKRSGLVEFSVTIPSPSLSGLSVLDGENHVLVSRIVSAEDHTSTYRVQVQVPDTPSLGYTVLHVVPGARAFHSDLQASGLTMENAALKVTVDRKTGCITRLFDKKDNFEALAPGGCGNQLQVFKDTPEKDDAWNIDPGTLDHMTPLTEADSVELVEHNAMRAVIRVTRHWQSSTFAQDLQLYAGSDELNIVNDIDWHETHVLLKSAFPLAATGPMATYEIPYGTIDRPTTRNNSWEDAKFEVPALRWADAGDGRHGLSLINESKYGYDCKDNVLRLTFLRSPIYPDPNADRGHQHFAFTLYPHAGSWKDALSVRRGYDYNYGLRAMQVAPHAGSLPPSHSFVEVMNPNVVLTAVKKAEDSAGLVLRFYEWAGKDGTVTLHVPAGARSATLTNLMEAPEGPSIPVTAAGELQVPVHPFEIVTVRVDYPRAVAVPSAP
jgi:alpha-mannosidase